MRTLLIALATSAIALVAGSALAASSHTPTAKPAPAPVAPIFGISDQKPSTMSDPRLSWLGVRYARLVVPWDAMRSAKETAAIDRWLTAARAHGVVPLVAFDQSLIDSANLPTPHNYLVHFLRFRARYPWVHEYTPWNEENRATTAMARHPKLAALYLEAITAHCHGCTVVAADLLDTPNMKRYVASFLRYAHNPTIWGLHNYVDVNRHMSISTARLLTMVKGSIWLTEVGGVVWRYDRKRGFVIDGERHAAYAARWLFHLARMSPRIQRIYYYNWQTLTPLGYARRHPGTTWDSALIGMTGRPRPAFYIVARALGLDPHDAPAAPPRNPADDTAVQGGSTVPQKVGSFSTPASPSPSPSPSPGSAPGGPLHTGGPIPGTATR